MFYVAEVSSTEIPTILCFKTFLFIFSFDSICPFNPLASVNYINREEMDFLFTFSNIIINENSIWRWFWRLNVCSRHKIAKIIYENRRMNYSNANNRWNVARGHQKIVHIQWFWLLFSDCLHTASWEPAGVFVAINVKSIFGRNEFHKQIFSTNQFEVEFESSNFPARENKTVNQLRVKLFVQTLKFEKTNGDR